MRALFILTLLLFAEAHIYLTDVTSTLDANNETHN